VNPDGAAVAEACAPLLPVQATPEGYPNGLALCLLDSIWSLGVRYGSVGKVVDRYQRWVRDHDGNPTTRTSEQLVDDIANAGGSDAFAEHVVQNRARTSTRNGILKAEAVRRVASEMANLGISTPRDLCARADEQRVEPAWNAVKGQASGLSFHYALMLAGHEGIKPDRMIRRFVTRALDEKRVVSPERSEEAVRAALELLRADHPGLTLRGLDHAIWSNERSRKRQSKG
jgi:hypothetical protein